MDYELYHDESKIEGYWHGMLLIPVEQKPYLVNLLTRARQVCRYYDPIGIKQIKKTNRILSCSRSWLNIAFAALRSKINNIGYPIYLGDWQNIVSNPICKLARFILFRETSNLQNLNDFPDYGSKVETTFRFGIKGGVHALFNESCPISITKLHFDGFEHYARHIDKERVVGRLNGLRNYIAVTDDIDDRSSNHNLDESQSYEDCQFLQLTDLLIGSFRSALGHSTKSLHLDLAKPAIDYLCEAGKGYARMKNSRWLNSIWLSQCYLKDDSWVFEPLEIESKDQKNQLSLFEWK